MNSNTLFSGANCYAMDCSKGVLLKVYKDIQSNYSRCFANLRLILISCTIKFIKVALAESMGRMINKSVEYQKKRTDLEKEPEIRSIYDILD